MKAWKRRIPGWLIPLRIRDVHLKTGTENALGVVEARGSQDCSDGYRYVRHDMDGMPIELGDLLDRLSRKFRRRDIEEDIGTGGLDRRPPASPPLV